MSFFLITSIIFGAYYLFFTCRGVELPHHRIVLAGIFLAVQIVLTQLILGLLGRLYLMDLIFLNIAVTLLVLLCSSSGHKIPVRTFRGEKGLCRRLTGIFSMANSVLFVFVIFVAVWTIIRIYFLPPRAYDELAYHLTPIYEYIINHRIFLLPVKFLSAYSFPQNADLLFMWPAIFFHGQQFVHIVQFLTALWGVVIIYGLARALEISPSTAFFVSFLFIFTPVVLIQMDSSYIDIITGIFFLAALFCSVMYYKGLGIVYFYATAFTVSLLIGMKNNQPLLALTVLPILVASKNILKWRQWGIFGLILLLGGGFWYLRNLIILHSCIYFRGVNNYLQVFPIHQLFTKLLILYKDHNLGSIRGGFGSLFLGLAVPAWFYVFIKVMVKRRGEKEKIFMFLSLPFFMGVFQLLVNSMDTLSPRYSIFIIPLGLLALGEVLMTFNEIFFFKRIVKALCIVCILLNMLSVIRSAYPSICIDRAIKDYIRGQYLTKMYYMYFYPWGIEQAWGLLDYLTVDDHRGLSCYVASYRGKLSSAAYGSRLQNRLWNLEGHWQTVPDVFIYDFGTTGKKWLKYRGPKFTPDELKRSPYFDLILKNDQVLVFIRKDFIEKPEKQRLLVKFYENYLLEKLCPLKVGP